MAFAISPFFTRPEKCVYARGRVCAFVCTCFCAFVCVCVFTCLWAWVYMCECVRVCVTISIQVALDEQVLNRCIGQQLRLLQMVLAVAVATKVDSRLAAELTGH